MSSESSNSEVKSWLEVALKNENLENVSFEIVGTTENGQGFIGDVIFVFVTGFDKKGNRKEYNLVLKCSKSNKALLEHPMISDSYSNEIHMYAKIFPTFKQFQLDHGVTDPFDSVPKCYGTFRSESKYVIVLENLKLAGYHMWNTVHPLPRRHIDLVVAEYGKYHALSVALKEKQPGKFEELVGGLGKVMDMMFESVGRKLFETNIESTYELLKNDLGSEDLQRLLNVKEQIRSFARLSDAESLQVIAHGDCWNNNTEDRDEVQKVAILDWQLAHISSPVTDLSYFLFACSGADDINDLNTILKTYYDSFAYSLKQMKCNFADTYTFESLLQDWRKCAKYGAMLSLVPVKNGFLDKEDVPDINKDTEMGENFADNFIVDVTDKEGYKRRILPIVNYALEFGLI